MSTNLLLMVALNWILITHTPAIARELCDEICLPEWFLYFTAYSQTHSGYLFTNKFEPNIRLNELVYLWVLFVCLFNIVLL